MPASNSSGTSTTAAAGGSARASRPARQAADPLADAWEQHRLQPAKLLRALEHDLRHGGAVDLAVRSDRVRPSARTAASRSWSLPSSSCTTASVDSTAAPSRSRRGEGFRLARPDTAGQADEEQRARASRGLVSAASGSCAVSCCSPARPLPAAPRPRASGAAASGCGCLRCGCSLGLGGRLGLGFGRGFGLSVGRGFGLGLGGRLGPASAGASVATSGASDSAASASARLRREDVL